MGIPPHEYQRMQDRLDRAMRKQPEVKAASDAVDMEFKLQQEIREWLSSRCWFFIWQPMKDATTTPPGTPDFIAAAPNGKTLWLETKSKTGKQTIEQKGVEMRLTRNGHVYRIVRSMREFLAVVEGETKGNS